MIGLIERSINPINRRGETRLRDVTASCLVINERALRVSASGNGSRRESRGETRVTRGMRMSHRRRRRRGSRGVSARANVISRATDQRKRERGEKRLWPRHDLSTVRLDFSSRHQAGNLARPAASWRFAGETGKYLSCRVAKKIRRQRFLDFSSICRFGKAALGNFVLPPRDSIGDSKKLELCRYEFSHWHVYLEAVRVTKNTTRARIRLSRRRDYPRERDAKRAFPTYPLRREERRPLLATGGETSSRTDG